MLQNVTRSKLFTIASGTAIFLNVVFIGWTTQWLAARAESYVLRNDTPPFDEPMYIFFIQSLFCLFFFCELMMRWMSEGLCDFFRSQDQWWNVLDVVIVMFGVLDVTVDILVRLEAWSQETANVFESVSVLRGLRVMRVVKMARVIRVMKYFRELRIMIFSILGSLKSLTWVALSMGMMFYIFGIVFTSAVTGYWEIVPEKDYFQEKNLAIHKHFGTLYRSMISLYMAMSSGNDWALYYEALEVLPFMYRGLFVLFITISVFAVVNIVTGVFVEHAMQSSAHDREVVVNEELQAKRLYLSCMREVFEEMDIDDSGMINESEFETRLNDERVIAYCGHMKLDVSDARALFRLMDYDQSGEVSIDEFLDACLRLQGESRRIDMKMMQSELKYLSESFRNFKEALDAAWGGSLRTLQTEIADKEGQRMQRLVEESERHQASKEPSTNQPMSPPDQGYGTPVGASFSTIMW